MFQKKEHMLLCSIFQFSKPTTSERSVLLFVYTHILLVEMFITLSLRCRILTLEFIRCSISPGWLSSVFENWMCAFSSCVWVSRNVLANERNRSKYQVSPHCLRRYLAMVHDDVIKWKKKSSALLAFCVGNSPVTGEFLAQRPVTRSFDVFFDLSLNKRLSEQSWGWWFGTSSPPLWRHSNV